MAKILIVDKRFNSKKKQLNKLTGSNIHTQANYLYHFESTEYNNISVMCCSYRVNYDFSK